ncbi:Tc1-like transposase DDE domain-containing protein [Methylorubrum extorquens]
MLEGTAIGRRMQRHCHEEFLRFLNAVEAALPAGKVIPVVLDNDRTHTHARVRLSRHRRWVLQFTPTSASWLNAVEGFFSALSRRRLRHGTLTGIVDLQAAIKRYIAERNERPKPFVWTKIGAAILNSQAEPSV